jgi:uncharacterized protein YndB with AHSA1/START domain
VVRIEQTFRIGRPPEVVFDYVTEPSNLSRWQTSNRSVEQLSDGPPRLGARFRERTKPAVGKQFEQVTEFSEFERPRRLRVEIIEGPFPGYGAWTFEPDGEGTRVQFVAEAEIKGAMKVFSPIAARILARQFAGYHRNLRSNVERS